MKRSIVLPVALLSGSALFAGAQAPPAQSASAAPASAAAPAGHSKIAVIAFQVAVSQTNEFQRNFADLEKKWEPKREELKKLSDDIDASTKALQTQGSTLSEADRASRAKALDTKKKQFDRSAEDAQNDFQQAVQDLYSGMASKVYDVLSSYAKSIKKPYRQELDRLAHWAPGDAAALKSLKRLLLRVQELSETERTRLGDALKNSRALATLLAMRQELTALWERSSASKEQLLRQLQDWCHRAESSGIAPLQDFSRRLRCYA